MQMSGMSGRNGASGMAGMNCHGQQTNKPTSSNKTTVQETPVANELAKSVEPHKGHTVDLSA